MRFQCQQGCRKCCEKKGFVYLSEADTERIADFLGLSVSDFEQRYLYRTKNFRRLRKPRNAQCPFLTEHGCAVHEVKPTQCRVFPLWPEIVEDAKELAATAKWCPGIGTGPHVLAQHIRKCAEEMTEAYPAMYEK